MKLYKPLLSIAVGLGLALGAGAGIAQDLPDTPLTKPSDANDDASKGSKPETKSKGTPQDGSQGISFKGLDINTDRKLSRDEVKTNTKLSADFDKLDADRNGSLSDGEFAKFEASGGDAKSDKKSGDKSQQRSREAEQNVERESREAERDVKDAAD